VDLLSWWADRGGRKQALGRIAALEEAHEGLKREYRVIRLEWEDVYDRLTRTMGRLNARIRKNEAQEPTEGPRPEPEGEVKPSGTHGLLKAARARRVGM